MAKIDPAKVRLEQQIVKAARNYSYNNMKVLEFPESDLMYDLLYSSTYNLLSTIRELEEYEDGHGLGYT